VSIQQRAGGNLSEALGNLSRVLRDRKKMKAKIKAMSMEAKASASIIGALPIAVMLLAEDPVSAKRRMIALRRPCGTQRRGMPASSTAFLIKRVSVARLMGRPPERSERRIFTMSPARCPV
jgi:hypothetical protein